MLATAILGHPNDQKIVLDRGDLEREATEVTNITPSCSDFMLTPFCIGSGNFSTPSALNSHVHLGNTLGNFYYPVHGSVE